MQTVSNRLAGTLLIITLTMGGCAGQDPVHVLELDESSAIVLEGVLSVSDIAFGSDGFVVVDDKSVKVSLHGHDGRLIRGIGSPGPGPGEYERPRSVDVLNDQIFVTERSGRTSLFRFDGSYVTSIRPGGLLHMNSNIAAASDTSVVIGGYYSGAVAGLWSTTGDDWREMLPLSPKSEESGSTLVVGATCDSPKAGNIWCVQTMDYELTEFSLQGFRLRSFSVESSSYRPVTGRQPPDGSSTEAFEWLKTWDWISGVFSVNDEFLIVTRMDAEAMVSRADVISKESGALVSTWDLGEAKLVASDDARGDAIFLLSSRDEMAERIVVEPINTFLGGVK